MPVQTQTRSQPVPANDPFGDQNPVRLVSTKVHTKRDTAADNHRETATPRGQDPHRAKPIRSQTQQPVGSVDHFNLPRYEYSFFLPFLL